MTSVYAETSGVQEFIRDNEFRFTWGMSYGSRSVEIFEDALPAQPIEIGPDLLSALVEHLKLEKDETIVHDPAFILGAVAGALKARGAIR